MLAGLFSLYIVLIAALAVSATSHGSPHHNRHVEIAKRQAGDVQLFKRFTDARWTFYAVGLGACGVTNVPTDFIVALNSDQFGSGYPGPYCFQTITMSYNGKTTTATVMDECPGCPYGGLDLSVGLFTYFAAESVGVLYGTWSFNDGSSDSASTTSTYVAPTTTKHTTTSTKTPEPTTTYTPPTTSTTKTSSTSTSYTSTSTSSSHSSSSSSSSSSKASSSSHSASSSTHSTSSTASATSAAPSATPSSTGGNLASLEQGFLQLGVMVVAAA